MDSPTLSDVARAAGVSYATADRVINDRGNVAEKSIRKVRDAMTSLGYVRNIAAANLSRGRVYRLAFLLPKGRNAFFNRMRDHLTRIADHLQAERVSIEVIEIAAFAIDGLKDSLASITSDKFDGVAVVGLQSTALNAPFADLQAQGIPVVGLVSDLLMDHRSAYIGIDNIAAGREAAEALIRLGHVNTGMVSGRFAASDRAIARREGFVRCLSEKDYPAPLVLEVDYIDVNVQDVLA